MTDRYPCFLLRLPDLERLVRDVRSGAADDLDAYLAEHWHLWTVTQDTEGNDVDVVMLKPTGPVAAEPVH